MLFVFDGFDEFPDNLRRPGKDSKKHIVLEVYT